MFSHQGCMYFERVVPRRNACPPLYRTKCIARDVSYSYEGCTVSTHRAIKPDPCSRLTTYILLGKYKITWINNMMIDSYSQYEQQGRKCTSSTNNLHVAGFHFWSVIPCRWRTCRCKFDAMFSRLRMIWANTPKTVKVVEIHAMDIFVHGLSVGQPCARAVEDTHV